MALADLNENGKIIVTGTAQDLMYVSRIPGAKKTVVGGCPAYTLPATLDSCLALKAQHFPFSEQLSAFGNRKWKIRKYIEQVKLQTDPVKPLQPIPIKAPYSLYQHQIKAYNIALALFGRGARREASG